MLSPHYYLFEANLPLPVITHREEQDALVMINSLLQIDYLNDNFNYYRRLFEEPYLQCAYNYFETRIYQAIGQSTMSEYLLQVNLIIFQIMLFL